MRSLWRAILRWPCRVGEHIWVKPEECVPDNCWVCAFCGEPGFTVPDET